MNVRMDSLQGKVVGSKIAMEGRFLGLRLGLDEVVTVRNPPWEKVWETAGVPKLLVIGPYRMGVRVRKSQGGCFAKFYMDYQLADAGLWSWLGKALGAYYAKWCLQQMAQAVQSGFGQKCSTQQ